MATDKRKDSDVLRDDNRRGSPNKDPITGAPGAHPVGTVAGPIGTAAGAAVGAIVGGLAGKGIAEHIDPTVEEAYWAENYSREPYYEKGYTFQDYHPGYRTGWEARTRYPGKTFDEIDRDLAADYEKNRGQSKLDWERNRLAARAAWNRFE
jgi:hypothetical protein